MLQMSVTALQNLKMRNIRLQGTAVSLLSSIVICIIGFISQNGYALTRALMGLDFPPSGGEAVDPPPPASNIVARNQSNAFESVRNLQASIPVNLSLRSILRLPELR